MMQANVLLNPLLHAYNKTLLEPIGVPAYISRQIMISCLDRNR